MENVKIAIASIVIILITVGTLYLMFNAQKLVTPSGPVESNTPATAAEHTDK